MDKKTLRSVFSKLDLSNFGYQSRLFCVHKETDLGVHQCDLGIACDEDEKALVFVHVANHGMVRYSFFLAFEKRSEPDVVVAALIELCNILNANKAAGVGCLSVDPSTDGKYITVTLSHVFGMPPSFYDDAAQAARLIHAENMGCFAQAILRVMDSLSNSIALLNERGICDSKLLSHHPEVL